MERSASAGHSCGMETGPSGQVRSAGFMDFRDTPAEAAFRDEVRTWLSEHLKGEFAELGPSGGPADEAGYEIRIEWEKLLGKDKWVGEIVKRANWFAAVPGCTPSWLNNEGATPVDAEEKTKAARNAI